MGIMNCATAGCSNARGGRNKRCWKCLKRSVRLGQAHRRFQKVQLLEEDLDSSASVLTLFIDPRGNISSDNSRGD